MPPTPTAELHALRDRTLLTLRGLDADRASLASRPCTGVPSFRGVTGGTSVDSAYDEAQQVLCTIDAALRAASLDAKASFVESGADADPNPRRPRPPRVLVPYGSAAAAPA